MCSACPYFTPLPPTFWALKLHCTEPAFPLPLLFGTLLSSTLPDKHPKSFSLTDISVFLDSLHSCLVGYSTHTVLCVLSHTYSECCVRASLSSYTYSRKRGRKREVACIFECLKSPSVNSFVDGICAAVRCHERMEATAYIRKTLK